MTQRSFFWNGASLGDADTLTKGGGYHMSHLDYESPFTDIMCRIMFNGVGNRGPLKSWLNELAVTGAATPVQIDTGAAFVYGLYYENSAALNVAITTPTSSTRIDMIVVRRNWITQTARITHLMGVEGSGAPAITQSPAPDGSGIYDIPLAQLSISTAGVIAVTDKREFCAFASIVGDGTIATAQIANNAVDWEQRAQIVKSIFFGGSDLFATDAYFSYKRDAITGGPVMAAWGNNAASMQGWTCSGSGPNDRRPFFVVFKPPADYVPGTVIYPYLWMVDDTNGTDADHTITSAWQAYRDGDEPLYVGATATATVATYTQVTDLGVSVALAPISGLEGDEMVVYCAIWETNDVTVELVVGLEFAYVGYT